MIDLSSALLLPAQEPYMRTEYRRSAFQEGDNNAVRISLDTQVRQINLAGYQPRGRGRRYHAGA